jgi:NitT/TauT family transport system substrate-binding protein
MTKEKRLTEDDLTASFSSKDLEFTKVPSRMGKMIEFLHSIGSVKNKPDSWKDLFFHEAHALPGS